MSLPQKPAVTAAPVHELIRDRWSPRAFADKPVPHEALVSVLEAGRWAASSNNGQPWRWIVATREDPVGYEAALAGFNARNQRWARTAPVLIFSLARKTFEANGNPNAHAWHDAGAANAQISLQATALGLHTHMAAGIERDRLRESFGIPEDFDICSGIALGYQGTPDRLPEELPGREVEPRTRKQLGEVVFSNRFGAAFQI
ncbi:MAG: nitroreductase family protein [Beijerinckiaceae bacterium]|nr:nitroreductase family protein [Beijerinckiaceae bacterium]